MGEDVKQKTSQKQSGDAKKETRMDSIQRPFGIKVGFQKKIVLFEEMRPSHPTPHKKAQEPDSQPTTHSLIINFLLTSDAEI